MLFSRCFVIAAVVELLFLDLEEDFRIDCEVRREGAHPL